MDNKQLAKENCLTKKEISWTMATYSMAQVETLTGIKSHTLRKWEDRYDFLKPKRTKTNFRYYDDEMLRLLLNITILGRNGYMISAIDKMDEQQINEKITELFVAQSAKYQDVESVLIALSLDLQEEGFNRLYQQQVNNYGLLITLTEIIYPFLRKVGLYWSTSKIIPAQERFISNLIRQKLIVAIDSLPIAKDDSPGLVLFLPEQELHELGLLLAFFIARNAGWRVYYLGQDVPVENVSATIRIANADVVMTIITTPRNKSIDDIISTIQAEKKIPILMSGLSPAIKKKRQDSRVTFLEGPNEFIQFLTDYLKTS